MDKQGHFSRTMRAASISSTVAMFSLVGAGMAFSRWSKNYKDESDRQAAIKSLKKSITEAYPRELADRLLTGFDSGGQDFNYDFDGEVGRYFDSKLYRFLLSTVNEVYADRFFARRDKFARYEVPASLSDLLARTLEECEMPADIAPEMERMFAQWLVDDQSAYVDTAASTHSRMIDNVKLTEIKAERRETLISFGNMFVTDRGFVVVGENFKVVEVADGRFSVFHDIAEFQQKNPKNKKWQYVDNEEQKKAAIQPILSDVIDRLYDEL